jgi:hypothetical protein
LNRADRSQWFLPILFGLLSDAVGAASLSRRRVAWPPRLPCFGWSCGQPLLVGLATIVNGDRGGVYGRKQRSFRAFWHRRPLPGSSIGYQLASPLAGGLAPDLVSLLEWARGQSWPVAVYHIVLSVMTLVSVWLCETH